MSHSQATFGYEIFDRFFVKFGLLANEIEKINRNIPDAISQEVMEKLHTLKRDTDILSREVKNIDNRSAERISNLERKCEKLNYEVSKLKEEVSNLLNINSELHQKLEESNTSGTWNMGISQKISNDKVNASTLYATEERADSLATQNKELRSLVETLKREKNEYFSKGEWLQTNLDDQIKKYNDILNEKIQLQDCIDDILREEHKGESIFIQLKHLQKQEVQFSSFRENILEE